MLLKNLFGHTKTILIHKFWVGHFCFLSGLYFQGIIHDLSKFSPSEFFESVKYYNGSRSPIDVCKEKNGYSMCWFHHRGRNKHHWEYWVDDFEKGVIPKKMPYKYALEMICDFLGAGITYSGGLQNFSMQNEMEWWYKKRDLVIMHEDTKHFVDCVFSSFLRNGINETLTDKDFLIVLERNYRRGYEIK